MAQRRLVKQAAFTLPVIFFFGCAADPGDTAKDGGIVVATVVSNNTTITGSSASGSNGTYGSYSTPSTAVMSIGPTTMSSTPSGGTSTTSSTPSGGTSTTSSSSSSSSASSSTSSSSSTVVPPTDGGCVVLGPAPANVVFHVTTAFCVQSTGAVMGWQGSNMAGRTVTIIGATTQSGVAASGSSGAIAVGSNGAVIWEFTGGTDGNAEMSWW